MLLDGLTPPIKVVPCKVRTLFETLDPSDVEILRQALDDEVTWPAKTLQRALADKGVSLIDSSISRHRTKVCSCSKI
jgi:hypothetical protein